MRVRDLTDLSVKMDGAVKNVSAKMAVKKDPPGRETFRLLFPAVILQP